MNENEITAVQLYCIIDELLISLISILHENSGMLISFTAVVF